MKALLLVSVAAAMFAGTAAAVPLPPTSYWTVAQANAAVIHQATRPYCAVLADVSKCANGLPLPGVVVNPIVTDSSTCVGVAAFSWHGRFSQFVCKVASNNQVAPGTLHVYTAGATKIRWRRVTP